MTAAPVVTAATATQKAKDNPTGFIPLPEPLTPGNEVVAVVATNIPTKGFSDKQIEQVKFNKARNAKMDAAALTTRGFYYTVLGKFNMTNHRCTPLIGATIRHALQDAIKSAVGMTDKPDAADTQHCYPGVIDEKHAEDNYSENDYLVAKDRSTFMTDLQTYVDEVVHMIHDADFSTLLNHAIAQEGDGNEHTGSEVEFSTEVPKVIGFIVLEGPPGSSEKLQKSNGPIAAS